MKNVNGEAIYKTRPWRRFGEGPTQIVEGQFADGIQKNFTHEDFRFTTGGGALYVIAMKASPDGKYCIHSLGEQDASKQANFHGIIRSVTALDGGAAVPFTRDENGLYLEHESDSDMPVAFKLIID